jgi:hypothetical protein
MSLRDSSIEARVSAFGTLSSIGKRLIVYHALKEDADGIRHRHTHSRQGLASLRFYVVIDTYVEHGALTHLELLKKYSKG